MQELGNEQVENEESLESEINSEAEGHFQCTPVFSEIRHLHRDYLENLLSLQSDFQRNFVWDKKKASYLIESIFLNIPIPAIFVAKSNGKKTVIDGQQRLTSIFSYIQGTFPNQQEGNFKLTSTVGKGKDYHNKTFKELSDQYKNKIYEYKMSIFEIDAEKYPETSFIMFERINSGSIKLSQQELRNCLYRGPYNNLIKELSQNEDFLYILNLQDANKRKQNEELVLLFFTIVFLPNGIDGLTGNISATLLNKAMSSKKNLNSIEQEEYRKLFLNTVKKVKEIFNQQAFRRNQVFNRGLFITVMSVLSKMKYTLPVLISLKDTINKKYLQLLSNQDFLETITKSTLSKAISQKRNKAFESMLDYILSTQVPQGQRLFTYQFRQALYDKDPTCQICKNRIDDVSLAQVDHIQAYAKGGATVPENAQLVHRTCNQQKGAS